MGRPPLNVQKTTVRLEAAVLDRVRAVAGENRVSEFIRAAVQEKLQREEKG